MLPSRFSLDIFKNQRTGITTQSVAGLLLLPAPADNAAMEAEPINSDSPKRERRWFQFSLRTLMIGVLIIAIPCAWLGRKIEQKRRERAAVRAILNSGAHFYFHYENANGSNGLKMSQPSSSANWLQDLFGDDFDTPPTWVWFNARYIPPDVPKSKKRIDDRALINLNALPYIRTVDLSRTTVSDADLERLKGLTWLKRLRLDDTQVTHAGILELRKATSKLPGRRIVFARDRSAS